MDVFPNIGIQIIDISNPANPVQLGFFETKKVEGNTSWYQNPQRVAADGNYAYIGCRAQGSILFIADISDPTNPVQAGSLEFDEGSFPNYESMQMQYPYILAATGPSSVGLIQINVSDPGTPEIELRYEDPWNSRSMATWGDTLYVSSSDRLWVYDYSDTTKPTLLGSDTTWAELTKSQVKDNYLFGTTENVLHILDVADPNNIFEVGIYSSANGNIIEIVIYENFAYLLTVNENQSLLEIVNISDPNSPTKETGEYIFPGTGRDICLYPDNMFALAAYFVDETDQGFQIIDFSDFSELTVLGTAQTIGNPIAIGVSDTLAIVGSNSENNWHLEAFNIVDPSNPVNIGSLDGGGMTHQKSSNSHTIINNKLARLKKLSDVENSQTTEFPFVTQNVNLIPQVTITDISVGVGYRFKDKIAAVISLPGGSLHFYFLQPGAGTAEWILKAICPSPSSTVIAAISKPLYATFFSIDGWFDPVRKLVSGTMGIFVQRLILNEYLVDISIIPQDTTIEQGDKVIFRANGEDNFGNPMATNVIWTATGGIIDAVTGEYTASDEGEYIITATDSANDISTTATVKVNKAKVVLINVSPPEATVENGDTIRYTAKGFDKYGTQRSINAKWSASGGNIDPGSGLYTATEIGEHTVTATDSGNSISGSATVIVNKGKLVSITVSPPDATVEKGDTIRYTSKGYDKYGNEISLNAKWSASGGNIDPSTGLYTATEIGEFTVSASDSNSGISGSATVKVTKAKVVTVTIVPADTSISFGDLVQFKAKGLDKNGNETGANLFWETTGGEINPTTGLFVGSEAGDFVITATDTGSSVSGYAAVIVIPTGVRESNIKPKKFGLSQNYPNPFNPTTTIEFSVKETCPVKLTIYNVRGRIISTLVNKGYEPGIYKINLYPFNKLG